MELGSEWLPGSFCFGEGGVNPREESEALTPLIVAHGADQLGSSSMEHPETEHIELPSAVPYMWRLSSLSRVICPLTCRLYPGQGEGRCDVWNVSPSPSGQSAPRGNAAVLGARYPPLKDLGLVLRQHRHKRLGQLVDVLEVIPSG